MFVGNESIAGFDDEMAEAIAAETLRQEQHIELIASENYASPRVMQAQGGVLTNKYAEGYPHKRYYGGCEYVDQVEVLAIERAKRIIRRRLCQCSTPFRVSSQCSGLSGIAQWGRHGSRHESG